MKLTELDYLYKHPFVDEIILDSKELGSLKMATKKYADSEIEFYINNSAFYLVHFISLLNQLENAIELFSNYNYGKKTNVDRGKHLTYNYENFLIRICTITDRLLQLVNAIYYLGINEKDVKERSILNNDKVVVTDLPIKYKDLSKVLNKYIGNRNQVVHRHSYIEKKLKTIEIFYHPELTRQYFESSSPNEIEKMKSIRKNALTDFIRETKTEFRETNNLCIKHIHPIFNELHLEYLRIKNILNVT